MKTKFCLQAMTRHNKDSYPVISVECDDSGIINKVVIYDKEARENISFIDDEIEDLTLCFAELELVVKTQYTMQVKP